MDGHIRRACLVSGYGNAAVYEVEFHGPETRDTATGALADLGANTHADLLERYM